MGDSTENPASDKSQGKYPRPIGHKFTPEGAVLPFAGNTLIAHLSPQSPFSTALQAMQADIQRQDWGASMALLPASSWHMTIYDCVAYRYRTRSSYPADVPLDSSLKSCHAHFATRLADLEHGLGPQGVGPVAVTGYDPITQVIAFRLRPTRQETETGLRDLRDRLSARLKMRHGTHETYLWHLTLGYVLRFWTPDEEVRIKAYLEGWLERLPKTFELGVPEFCVYDDMCEFRRMYYLE